VRHLEDPSAVDPHAGREARVTLADTLTHYDQLPAGLAIPLVRMNRTLGTLSADLAEAFDEKLSPALRARAQAALRVHVEALLSQFSMIHETAKTAFGQERPR